MNKILIRLKVITQFGVSQIVSVLSTVLLSFLIVRLKTVELWGEYAEVLVWSNFLLLFLSFGNNDYLLKTFSNDPSKVYQFWINNLLSRSILLIPCFLIIFFIPTFNNLEYNVALLILFQFFNQSFKSIIVFYRKFKLNVIIEILFLLILLSLVFVYVEDLSLKLLIQIITITHIIKFLSYLFTLLKGLEKFKIELKFYDLKRSLPFFIPIAIGTFRSKIDIYYSSLFFNNFQLSKYQILISFLALSQMTSTFAITPYLKNYYRFKKETIKKTQQLFFYLGWPFALISLGLIYLVLNNLYQFNFTILQYVLVFLFIVPLFVHVLLVSEYYKNNYQNKIAYFATLVVIIQIIVGYFIINRFTINGALITKALGQWLIVYLLWYWIKKRN